MDNMDVINELREKINSLAIKYNIHHQDTSYGYYTNMLIKVRVKKEEIKIVGVSLNTLAIILAILALVISNINFFIDINADTVYIVSEDKVQKQSYESNVITISIVVYLLVIAMTIYTLIQFINIYGLKRKSRELKELEEYLILIIRLSELTGQKVL